MLKFTKRNLSDELRNGIQYHATTKHGLWCSLVCHDWSYGGKEGKFELGIFVPDKTHMRTRYSHVRQTLPDDVVGWLELDEGKAICERFKDYPAHKLTLAYKYFRLAQRCKSKQKAQKFQRKANRLLNQLPPIPSQYPDE